MRLFEKILFGIFMLIGIVLALYGSFLIDNTDTGFMPLIIIGFGAIFFLFGFIPYRLFSRGGERKLRRLRNEGECLTLPILRVEKSNLIAINDRTPFHIVAEYHDQENNHLYRFKSPFIWYDPSHFLVSHRIKEIKVYYNPNNFKDYAMDIDAIPEKPIRH